ncbi:hypothetical protein [Methanolobus sp. WCC5]|jgi:Ser/Thr protein kinase RdoA (MazF antagonist)|uniref:hypothetical protein n=1 Tax=Methanolobus sp. WCC5 TaxID=3125785 RepID=UPI00324B7543
MTLSKIINRLNELETSNGPRVVKVFDMSKWSDEEIEKYMQENHVDISVRITHGERE